MGTDHSARQFTASDDDAGTRLDVWLAGRMPELSRARLQALIRDGSVRARDGRPLRPRTTVTAGLGVDVCIPCPRPVSLEPEAVDLDVLYEDGDVIVINKPAGMVVHPAAGHAAGTLVNALLHHCRDLAGIGGELRPGIVHRLDKDTSGVMVAAKTDAAMAHLVAAFKQGRVGKEYLAVVRGCPVPASGRIETLIGRSAHDRKKMSARPPAGRRAVTHYAVEERFGGASLVRVRIETGRTHQIRVHMTHLGHPVLGDRQYGRAGAAGGVRPPRQMLHAHRLIFALPDGSGERTFCAPVPDDMAAVFAALRGNATGSDGLPDRSDQSDPSDRSPSQPSP
jgi:23S rRNA pseudouridine1911/1915/1917 synthase